jgi:hypothetical protein
LIGVLILLGGTFLFAVLSNQFCAKEDHLKAKILMIPGLLFGLGIIIFSVIYLPTVLIAWTIENGIIIILGLVFGIMEAALATHFDPMHGY